MLPSISGIFAANVAAHAAQRPQHDWRDICTRAIEDGRAATEELSATALKSLTDLPPERRAALLDTAADSRVADLLPADRSKLRVSLVSAPGMMDPTAKAKAEAAERRRQADVLLEYIRGYTAQLRALLPELSDALAPVYPSADDLAAELIKKASTPELQRDILRDAPRRWFVSGGKRRAAQKALDRLSALSRARSAVKDQFISIMDGIDDAV